MYYPLLVLHGLILGRGWRHLFQIHTLLCTALTDNCEVLGAIKQKNPFLLYFVMPHAPSDPDVTIICGAGNWFYGRPVSVVGRLVSVVGRPDSVVGRPVWRCMWPENMWEKHSFFVNSP